MQRIGDSDRAGDFELQLAARFILLEKDLQFGREIIEFVRAEVGGDFDIEIAGIERIEIEFAVEAGFEDGFAGEEGVEFVPAVGGGDDVEDGVDLVEGHRQRAGDAGVVDDFSIGDLNEPHAENVAELFVVFLFFLRRLGGGIAHQVGEADEVAGVGADGLGGDERAIQDDFFDDDRLAAGGNFAEGEDGLVAGDDVDGFAGVGGIVGGEAEIFEGDGKGILVRKIGKAEARGEKGVGDVLDLQADPILNGVRARMPDDEHQSDGEERESAGEEGRNVLEPFLEHVSAPMRYRRPA